MSIIAKPVNARKEIRVFNQTSCAMRHQALTG